MRILADYHHHDLYESLEILFRDRFGWELYRPIGMDWFDQGYWNLEREWHGDAIARQYLEPWGDDGVGLDHGTRLDRSHDRLQRLLTVEQARAAKIDLVIASVAHNHEGLHRFAREIGAKFALHLGNVRFSPIDMAEDRWDLADFGLVTSILPRPVPKPHVVYHQEFSTAEFRYEPPPRKQPLWISSFVQCFPENRQAYADFTLMANRYPHHSWRVYGAYGSAPADPWACGNLPKCADVAAAMRAADVAWHAKQWSDGYGHVIHNWFATGRPVFGFERYYRDQMAAPLWVDGVTSIDIGRRTPDEVAHELERIRLDEDHHLRMSEAAAARFAEVVDFDADAAKVRALIEAMVP